MHVGAGSAEDVPDIVVTSFEIFNAHVAVFVGADGIPHVHQAFHLVGLGLFHEVGVHLEHEALGLEVQEGTCFQEILLQKLPVLIGHAARSVPIAIELSALDVDGHVGVVGQVLLRVGELIEDVDHLLLGEAEQVEAGLQRRDLAGRVVAGHAVGADRFELKGCAALVAAVDINVDDVACIGYDARRT